MWLYEKRLEYPINITQPNAKMASFIISQYGGPDGEMGASMRYLSQRYSMENRKVAGLLTDIGTEELAHLEMVATIVRQLTKGLSAKELEDAGFAPYYIDHTAEESRSMHASSSQKATPSRICLKIWRQSRRREQPTIISCVWSRIRRSQIRSGS